MLELYLLNAVVTYSNCALLTHIITSLPANNLKCAGYIGYVFAANRVLVQVNFKLIGNRCSRNWLVGEVIKMI